MSLLVLNRAWIYSEFGYRSLLLAAVMLAILPILMSFAAARDLAMARSGSKHAVTATAERVVDPPLMRGKHWHYRLSEGSQQLPGELVLSHDGLNPGDLIVVYSAGEWHELASDVEPADFWVIPADVSFLVCLPFGWPWAISHLCWPGANRLHHIASSSHPDAATADNDEATAREVSADIA